MSAWPRHSPARACAVLACGCLLALVIASCGSSAPGRVDSTSGLATSVAPTGSGATSSPSWLGYHANDARTGFVATGPPLDPPRVAWSADLGGAVYGQPVIADGRIIAATESDRVVALDPANGAVQWSVSLGSPLTNVQAVAGCGDIDPLGITSTPVIDPSTGTVYVVGEVSDGTGSVHHQLEGLSIATGAVRLSEDVDPPLPAGENAVNLLQRASLALGNGRVYVSFGGNDGDCGTYHGWEVAVKESGAPDTVAFEVASDGQGGAIWQGGGAPALDAAGDVFVSTGNANPDPPTGGPDPLAYTESAVKLGPTLAPLASFKDRLAGGDEDLSTGNPVLLPDGDLFVVGKTDVGYLLRQSDLSEVGAVRGVCGSDPDGGPAFDSGTNRIFVPCRSGGIEVLDLTSRTVLQRLTGADSAPIIVGATVWSVQHSSGTLTGFDAVTLRTVHALATGHPMPIFASPSVGAGLMLIGTTTGIVAID